jgi:hypothetical protein
MSFVTLLALSPVVLVGAATAEQFVGERFAPVVSLADSDAMNVRAISVGGTPSTSTTFVVTFARPFDQPGEGYRVMASVGDPTAKRTRSTLEIVEGQAVGRVETGDGTTWDEIGPTPVSLDSEAGRATIDVPTTELPPESAVWVDVEVPTPVGPVGAFTPSFSYDALVRPPPAPTTAGTPWAWVRDAAGDRVDGATHVPGAPPTVGVVNAALVIASPEAPPTLLLGQPVVGTADYVRLLGPDDSAGGYVLVNRVSGEVALYSVTEGVATEVPSATQDLEPGEGGSAETQPPGTRTVSLDLATLERLLGLSDDPSSVALSVDRAIMLADGRVVTSTGVAATVAALEGAAVPDDEGEPAVVVEVDDDAGGVSSTTVAVLVGAGALVLLLVGGAVLVGGRARRKRQSLLAEGWFDREVRPTEPGPGTADAVGGSPSEHVDHETDDADAGEEAAVEGRASVSEARASQEDALARMEAEVAQLIDRVDRLGGDDADPAP